MDEGRVEDPSFLLAVCQAGAESAFKHEVTRDWPDLRVSYSRPGFLTFRLPEGQSSEPSRPLSTFARTQARSFGRAEGATAEQLAEWVWRRIGDTRLQHLHVWERDRQLPGTKGFQPGPSVLADEVATQIVAAIPVNRSAPAVNQTAAAGETVLDCVLVEPGEWWLGLHEASSPPSRWPGGVWRTRHREDPISRAYFKMEEALHWSRWPCQRGDLWAEIGVSPGGSAEALLDRGLSVIGIDPAEVDPSLAERRDFRHVRKRAADMRRREFRGVKWLSADANVAPKSTLDEIEPIVTHDSVRVRGLLLTLKLLDWGFAEQIPEFVSQVRGWGFEYVRCRQLSHQRREFCLAALRSRSMRRPPRRRASESRVAVSES